VTTILASSVPPLDAALLTLATAHPEARARLDRAAQLVAAEAVTPIYGLGYLVASQSEPGRSYWVQLVDGRWTCECEDFRQRGGPCKHAWATILFATAERLDAEQGDPTGAPVAFPTPAYSAVDRFELTPQGEAAVAGRTGEVR
jgi:hypothetical protein